LTTLIETYRITSQKSTKSEQFNARNGAKMSENEMHTDIQKREIKPRERGRDPLATTCYNDKWYSAEEAAEMERRFKVWQAAYRKEGKDIWEQTHQGKLCLAFY
jgi:hypothetical protein